MTTADICNAFNSTPHNVDPLAIVRVGGDALRFRDLVGTVNRLIAAGAVAILGDSIYPTGVAAPARPADDLGALFASIRDAAAILAR